MIITKRTFKKYVQSSQETMRKETLFIQYIIFNGLLYKRIIFYYFLKYIVNFYEILLHHQCEKYNSVSIH